MINNDRYYEPEDDDSDLLDERIADLMKEDYNPENYSNFAEAISEAEIPDRESVEMILQQSPFFRQKNQCVALPLPPAFEAWTPWVRSMALSAHRDRTSLRFFRSGPPDHRYLSA